MLLLLTGDIQTGKTRWLQARLDELERAGVACYGVVAPGAWREEPDGSLIKLAIHNVLLPGSERVVFARARTDARRRADGCAWEFDEAALARVNAHFSTLRRRAHDAREGREAPRWDAPAQPSQPSGRLGLLVIDELGPLELRRHAGLDQALAAAEDGPCPLWAHAVVVVRRALAAEALDRLAPSWNNEAAPILADEGGQRLLREVLLASQRG